MLCTVETSTCTIFKFQDLGSANRLGDKCCLERVVFRDGTHLFKLCSSLQAMQRRSTKYVDEAMCAWIDMVSYNKLCRAKILKSQANAAERNQIVVRTRGDSCVCPLSCEDAHTLPSNLLISLY